ncbi:MAG: tyrosine decarboxylase MfnA [Asgard group archaeon]|nr:tyrosine decarboxylase MfnA [Asgard group archaeon]
MEMNELSKNIESQEILSEIRNELIDELSYDRIFSSMCTPPPTIARVIASDYSELNLGDPGLFPRCVQKEQEVLIYLANLLNAPKTWSGSITSGGSESNLIGCWVARNWSNAKRGIKNGHIIIPKSAHVSFEKAIDILNIKAKWANLTNTFQIDIESVKNNISKETVGIIGIAGTTGTGVCDNIKALSELAMDHNLYLHIDAAYGGTIFPFLKDLGRIPPSFDFENEGVKSITIDTHKILGSLIPGGAIILRSKDLYNSISKNINYLSDSSTTQITITGTRPGNAVISSWVLLYKLGKSYLLNRVKQSLELTDYLIDQLKTISDISFSFKPIINIIGFTSKAFKTKELVDKLRQKGWYLSIYNNWIRIVVMPHLNQKTIDKFIVDLKSIIKEKKS